MDVVNYGILSAILLVTFFLYLPSLQHSFLAWDDNMYIRDNPLVHSVNLKEIFSQYVAGNYHPFTVLALAIEYRFFGLDPAGYHAVNLFLHLVNVVLVFRTVMQWSNKADVSLVAALLFAIHPMHVESVAWAAAQKDLLYTFFFLSSYLLYLRFTRIGKTKFLAASLLLFIGAMLSKAMAAPLPVLLILSDYFMGRKINAKTLLEKVPFFLVAFGLGIIAVFAQQSAGATEIVAVPPIQRPAIACMAFLRYLGFHAVPVNLSAYYPYPVKPGEMLPGYSYVYMIALVILAVATIYSLRYTKKIFFGMAFFVITVFLVLQLLPVGGAMMADRYSYIPSIGIFFLAGEGFHLLRKSKGPTLASALLLLAGVVYSGTTYARCQVWKNDQTVWNDVIRHYQNLPLAYNNRGIYLMSVEKDEEAMADFNKAIELKPEYFKAYSNRGSLFYAKGDYPAAIRDYSKAIALEPASELLYYNRAMCFNFLNRFDSAYSDYSTVLKLKPENKEALFGRANLLMKNGKMEQALADFNRLIILSPAFTEAYVNRGNLYRDQNRQEEALRDYDKAIGLTPELSKAWFNRANLYMGQKNYEKAIADFSRAIALNPRYDKAYYNRAMATYYNGNKEKACQDLEQASALGYQPATVALSQVCK